jgi:hypothetical protein
MRKLGNVEMVEFPSATHDAGGRIRTSQLTTLFDGKSLNFDNEDLWHSVGTGAVAFSNNTINMSVTSGQYSIRQSNVTIPYFSGKSQLVELTFENFQSQAGITKRVGYFSSSATTPYNTVLDGFFLESTPTEINLSIYNNGSLLTSIPSTLWDNYIRIKDYDWSKFTVAMFDFLWLGGTELRLFLKLPNDEFALIHTYYHAGANNGTFIKSPNQPIRYEINSTTGAGSLKAICSQVSTEGSSNESGESRALYTPALITCNTVGTVYALKGLKKQVAFRDNATIITSIGAVNGVTSDCGILMLLKDPTLSAPLTYANIGRMQEGSATTQTVTNTGRVLYSVPVSNVAQSQEVTANYLMWLQNKIDNSLSEYVVAYLPLTANQSIAVTINVKTFS